MVLDLHADHAWQNLVLFYCQTKAHNSLQRLFFLSFTLALETDVRYIVIQVEVK